MSETPWRDDGRPDPEELLDRLQLRDERPTPAVNAVDTTDDEDAPPPRQRGRLRIYVGMAAGVGKTYTMLNEGRRRKSRGTDVVIGYVETHGRPITEQQIGDLEIIPRRKVPYGNVTLEEMDLDAVLARHPQVVLVDELAHTNVPGSRHTKRYQDVAELQDAGINVITTLNVQHIEGLNDIVESITGVRQQETVPDSVLDSADELELIDISPDALRSRMRHGNIYSADKARLALDKFFTMGNLTALRELALRRVAEKTETQLEALMHGDSPADFAWATTATERVMVAFDARAHGRQLLRDGVRLARGLRAPLLAVTVLPSRADPPDKALEDLIRFAKDLGAEVITTVGRDIAAALAAVAHEEHVTQIVVGQPQRSRWQEFLRASVVNRLLRLPTGADIHVVPYRAPDVEP